MQQAFEHIFCYLGAAILNNAVAEAAFSLQVRLCPAQRLHDIFLHLLALVLAHEAQRASYGNGCGISIAAQENGGVFRAQPLDV
jgi:hypothetical protein